MRRRAYRPADMELAEAIAGLFRVVYEISDDEMMKRNRGDKSQIGKGESECALSYVCGVRLNEKTILQRSTRGVRMRRGGFALEEKEVRASSRETFKLSENGRRSRKSAIPTGPRGGSSAGAGFPLVRQ